MNKIQSLKTCFFYSILTLCVFHYQFVFSEVTCKPYKVAEIEKNLCADIVYDYNSQYYYLVKISYDGFPVSYDLKSAEVICRQFGYISYHNVGFGNKKEDQKVVELLPWIENSYVSSNQDLERKKLEREPFIDDYILYMSCNNNPNRH